ncbi:MAG: MOSC domain-containing protein [Planctomycetes bacterium]|nr:MOSC domain-containing protein [Planctomycetota bacterium]
MPEEGTIVEVCISRKKGTLKHPVGEASLLPDYGIENDAHAGPGPKQVSILCESSAAKLEDEGVELTPGVFAENLRIKGLDASDFPLGAEIRTSSGARLEVSQIGKECHSDCAIARQVGRCVMPTEGVFARVLEGGAIRSGDTLEVFPDGSESGGAGDK